MDSGGGVEVWRKVRVLDRRREQGEGAPVCGAIHVGSRQTG